MCLNCSCVLLPVEICKASRDLYEQQRTFRLQAASVVRVHENGKEKKQLPVKTIPLPEVETEKPGTKLERN